MKQHQLTHKTRDGSGPSQNTPSSSSSSRQASPTRQTPRKEDGSGVGGAGSEGDSTSRSPPPMAMLSMLPTQPLLPSSEEIRAVKRDAEESINFSTDEPAPKKHGELALYKRTETENRTNQA